MTDHVALLPDPADGTADFVLDLAADGEVLAASASAQRALGASWLPQLVAPEYEMAWATAFVRAAERGEPAEARIVLRRADGQRMLVQAQLAPQPAETPEAVVRVRLRDVTAEQRNQSERERLLATLEATTDVVAVMDIEGRLTWLNAAGRALAGLAADADVTGLPFSLLCDDDSSARVLAHGLPTVQGGASWSAELAFRAADGRIVPMSLLLLGHRSPRGNVWYVSAIARDMTDQKAREEALREREARFHRLADASRDGVLVCEAGRVFEANAAAERLLGVGPLQLEGVPVVSLFAPGARDRVGEVLARGLDGSIEVSGLRPGGEIDLELTATLIARDGRPAQVLVLRDIGGARALDRLKRDFVTTVSHELRTPLTSMRGALGLVAARPEVAGQPDTMKLLRIANENLDRLVRLVGDILDAEQLEAGGAPLRLAPVKVDEIVATAADGLLPMAASLAVTFSTALEPGLRVLGDRDRLVQVLTNLLSNALRFSPPEQAVTVRSRVAGDCARLEVEDRGPGIQPRELPRLFGRFAQLENVSAARIQGGSGLGLAISRAIVEQHRGRIGVESQPGERTVFWFEIPLVSPRTSEGAP